MTLNRSLKHIIAGAFAPGSDVSAMPANVQAVAAVVWTPEVIAAYEAEAAARAAAEVAQQGA